MPPTAGSGFAEAGFFGAARLAGALGVVAFGVAVADALEEAVAFGAAGFLAAGFLVAGAFAVAEAVEELAAFAGAFGFAGALGLAAFTGFGAAAGFAALRALVVLAFGGARRAVDFGAALRPVAFFGAGSGFEWVMLSATSLTVA